ncbi:MAG: hypothetical protein RSA10_02570 [Bacilli bacterium]
MKKNLIWMFLAVISGLALGKLTFDKYENKDVVKASATMNVYMIKYGTYASVDEMKAKIIEVNKYMYIEKDKSVSAYVGVVLNKNNANKVARIYNNVTLEKVSIDNEAFMECLKEYEKLLDVTDDKNSILIIEKQVINKYEELVVQSE